MAAQHGWTAAQGKAFLVSALNGQILQRASVMAFDDAFLFLTIMCLVALIPSVFLGRGRIDPAGESGAATPAMAVMD
jgi:hypothetical protein